MRKCNTCGQTTVELVHKQVTPVPAKSLYEDAISRGEFVGTFEQYQEFMKGPKGDDGVNGGGVYANTEW